MVHLGICIVFLTLNFNYLESAIDKLIIVRSFLIRVVVSFLEVSGFGYGISETPGIYFPVFLTFILVDFKHSFVRSERWHDSEDTPSAAQFTHEHCEQYRQI